MATSVEVTKASLTETQLVEKVLPPLAEGAVRLKVESFAVTANNITYAVIGDMFGYWHFFPTGDAAQGIVPMWGHAVVEASNHAGIEVGERVYGYLPMGTHVDVLPDDISPSMFRDATDYRQPMAIFYNQYSRLVADPEHDPAREAARMIFGPLFKTGFLLEAMFRREGWYGAEHLIMTSASSKTSLSLASVAKASSPGVKRVGLTSAGNVEFVKATGLYDEVLAYEKQCELAQNSAVLVDFAGNAKLLRSIHETLGDNLKYSCLVGATHVEARGGGSGDAPMPGPAPILFFAPTHAAETIKELTPRGFMDAVAARWRDFVVQMDGAVEVDERGGLEAARDAYLATLAGKADPAVGIVVRP
jgi:hypothetical protein